MFPFNRVYEKFKAEGVIFCFSGPISQIMLESIGEMLRKKMQRDLIVFSTIHKVFSVFIEQAQNILNYSAEVVAIEDNHQDKIRAGMLLVGYSEGHYYVCGGNYIETPRVDGLSHQLSLLQRMDGKELKQLFKHQLRQAPPAGSVGAGLGFIEIARRSTRPIEFEIWPAGDDALSFFMIKAVI